MKILKIIGIAAGVAVAGLAGLAIFNPGNAAETSPEHAETNLRTRRYRTSLSSFLSETEKLIPTLTKYGQSWRFVSSEIGENAVVIKAEVPVVFFTDDLTIKAESKDGETIVNVRSHSRVGKSDLGENRRHVVQILRALDEKFAGN